ncbi:MAG: stage III sporulation protein AC [Clostridia bacterium]|nr:stage III sporulation protein AC [Clostridia bacterium]
MDIGLILKIGGIGILVACVNQLLSKAGKDDLSSFVSLAGIIVILVMLMGEIQVLLNTVRNVFGI